MGETMNNIKKKIISFTDLFRRKRIIPVPHIVSEEMSFCDRVALISGGTGGIGFSIAKSLIESGCKVIIAGTNEEKLEIMSKKLGDNAASLKMDYSHIELIPGIIDDASKIFGKIDIFINSAGVHTDKVNFFNMTSEEYDRVMDINLKACFFACQSVGKYMVDNKIKGNILLVSSSRGSEPAWSPYGLSKWGIKGFTEGLAKILLPYGISVNAIAPGSTATPLIGISEGDSIFTKENEVNRYILPDEVAQWAKMLVSNSGSMIVGETLHISGGRGTIDIR